MVELTHITPLLVEDLIDLLPEEHDLITPSIVIITGQLLGEEMLVDPSCEEIQVLLLDLRSVIR